MENIINNFKPKGKRISEEEIVFLKEHGYKWCSNCKKVILVENFAISNSRKDGLFPICNSCRKIKYIENSNYIKNRQKKYREENPEKVKESRKNYYEKAKEDILFKNELYRQSNLDKIRIKQKEYRDRSEIRIHRAALNKKWRDNNLEKSREYFNKRYRENIEFKTRHICRQLIRRAFLSIGTSKEGKTRDLLGYSPIQLKEHIEKQFKEGMTWENYGAWQIDHKIPISVAKTLEDALFLSKLENLQPLWKNENLLKSNKIDD